MPTLLEALTARSCVLEPANEEFIAAPGESCRARRESAGWDPYEVWRVRIKEPLERCGSSPYRPPAR